MPPSNNVITSFLSSRMGGTRLVRRPSISPDPSFLARACSYAGARMRLYRRVWVPDYIAPCYIQRSFPEPFHAAATQTIATFLNPQTEAEGHPLYATRVTVLHGHGPIEGRHYVRHAYISTSAQNAVSAVRLRVELGKCWLLF